MVRYCTAACLALGPTLAPYQVSSATAASPTAAQAVSPSPCDDPAHHQFDFWVGRWDVYGPRERLVAHSLIESVYGCGIRENWMPISGQTGGSLSIYVPAERSWEQFWIDASGARVVFRGGWNGQAMVIAGIWATSPAVETGRLTRMTYTRNADGSVRQFGEQSGDEGHSWSPAFDFTYRPHVE
jgi:hypothetical protein